jgi:cytochrome c1
MNNFIFCGDCQSQKSLRRAMARFPDKTAILGDHAILWDFDIGIDLYTLPLNFLQNIMHFSETDCENKDITKIFNFMINKKNDHRYLTLRLIEYFNLADYIYTYMRTFYRDTSKITGWDNLAFPSAGMPHVLWERQGPREMTVITTQKTAANAGKPAGWERISTTYDSAGYVTNKVEPLANYTGKPTVEHKFKPLDPQRAAAYDRDMADLTGFMTWMSEPNQQKRKQIGVWVLLFLGIFFVIAWRLNASFWKHVK